MTDIAKLESDLLAAVGSAKDETALEAVRVSALGKSGSISALLKTLGAMTPDERKVQGPAIGLIVTAILGLLWQVFVLIMNLAGIGAGAGVLGMLFYVVGSFVPGNPLKPDAATDRYRPCLTAVGVPVCGDYR